MEELSHVVIRVSHTVVDNDGRAPARTQGILHNLGRFNLLRLCCISLLVLTARDSADLDLSVQGGLAQYAQIVTHREQNTDPMQHLKLRVLLECHIRHMVAHRRLQFQSTRRIKDQRTRAPAPVFLLVDICLALLQSSAISHIF